MKLNKILIVLILTQMFLISSFILGREMNNLVMSANGNKMPVYIKGNINIWVLGDEETHFLYNSSYKINYSLLSDFIPAPNPEKKFTSGIASLGDLLIWLGMFGIIIFDVFIFAVALFLIFRRFVTTISYNKIWR